MLFSTYRRPFPLIAAVGSRASSAAALQPRVGVAATIFARHPCSGALSLTHVALIKRATEPALGAWSFPGGRLALGESLAACAVREAREETGLSVTPAHHAIPAFAATDAISYGGPASGPPIFHYAVVHVLTSTPALVDAQGRLVLPRLVAGDDAGDAAWLDLSVLTNGGPRGRSRVEIELLVPQMREVLSAAVAAARALGARDDFVVAEEASG